MHGTRRHGHHRSDHRRESSDAPMYWGWSPESGQMEMMDLRRYVDAVRAGYDRALEDLYGRLSALSAAYGGGMPGMGPVPITMPLAGPAPGRGRPRGAGHGHGHGECGHHGHHGHGDGAGCCDDEHDDDHGHRGHHDGCGHHGHHDGCGHHGHHDGCGHHGHHGHKGHHRHGCGDTDDCRCRCCIVDADIVVYARCGEVRVVPIEIENDTRKDREGVELEVSGFRSGGGRPLPWKAALSQPGPITIRGCDTVSLELLVGVVCEKSPTPVEPGKEPRQPKEPAKPVKPAPAAEAGEGDQLVRLATNVRDRTGGVDSCTVGYVTVRVGGCLVRPIVVAVAVLPDDCGAYQASCSCGDCC